MTNPHARELVRRQFRCGDCNRWIEGKRTKFNVHVKEHHPETWARMEAVLAELLGVTP